MSKPVFYKFESSDGVVVKMCELATQKSKLLKDFCDGTSNETPIPLPKVDGATLTAIARWCEHNKNLPNMQKRGELSEWDNQFCNSLGSDLLFNVTCATQFLGMEGLMHVCCKFIANMARGKSVEELRIIYGIPTDEEDEAADRAREAAELAALENQPSTSN